MIMNYAMIITFSTLELMSLANIYILPTIELICSYRLLLIPYYFVISFLFYIYKFDLKCLIVCTYTQRPVSY